MAHEELNDTPCKGKMCTASQTKFVDAYVLTGKVSEAARICKMSVDYCYQMTRLPKYRHVQDAIVAAYDDYFEVTRQKRHLLVNFCYNVLTFDISKVTDSKGNLKPWSEIDPEDRQVLAEFSVKEWEGGFSSRCKPVNKAHIAQLLGRWGGMANGPQPKRSQETAAQIDEDINARLTELAREEFPYELATEETP